MAALEGNIDAPLDEYPNVQTPQQWTWGTCVVLLINREQSWGIGTTDITTWKELRDDAYWIWDHCILDLDYGGAVSSGQYNNLVLYMLESDSATAKELMSYVDGLHVTAPCKNDLSRFFVPGSCPSYGQDPENNDDFSYYSFNTYGTQLHHRQCFASNGECLMTANCISGSCSSVSIIDSQVLFGVS
ncbi:MAG: hypothetical protein M1827_000418 [Pycnora praestabilis]|nr:MAG: hypothetical protein M1827_000418 [Pycnora praestabilis]